MSQPAVPELRKHHTTEGYLSGAPSAKRPKPAPGLPSKKEAAGRSDPGPRAAQKAFPDLTIEQARDKLISMSKDLKPFISTQVEKIGRAAAGEAAAEASEKEDDFVGIIGGPISAPVTDAEQMVAAKVLGKGKVDDQVVGQARTVVASMIAGLIAYSNEMRVLVPAVKAAAGVGAVGVEAAAGAASASITMLQGLLSMPSLPMTVIRAGVPVAGFLCNPNVLALLPILFLGYSLSGRGDKDRLLRVLRGGKDAIVKKVQETYKVSEDVANSIVTRAVSVIGGAGDRTISMIKAVTSLYLKLFATACAVVGSAQAAGEAISGVPTTILDAFQSVRKSAASGMRQVKDKVDSFADRIKEAAMNSAKGVCEHVRGDGAGAVGGRKTRKRVGRRHRHRGKRGASTRKGKGKDKGRGKGHGKAAKRGGSTRKGKGKAKGKGRGSSTRRRHSRKH